MCSHYIILTAFKGSCQNLQEELFGQQNGRYFDIFAHSTILSCFFLRRTIELWDCISLSNLRARASYFIPSSQEGRKFKTFAFKLNNFVFYVVEGMPDQPQHFEETLCNVHTVDVLPSNYGLKR